MDKNNYKEFSKKKLLENCKTKIKTTMIGALEIIEKTLMSEDEELFKSVYNTIRKEILDKGNTQIRNLEDEFVQYEIHWNRYTLKLPVKPIGQKEGNKGND